MDEAPTAASTPAAAMQAAAAHAAATPLRTGLRLLLPLLCIVALLLLLLGAGVGGVRWLLFTENGTAWLLQRVPTVQVKGFSGALLGPAWRAESVRVKWAGGQQWLLLEGLVGDGLRWTWRPNAHAWVGLEVQALKVQKLSVQTGPAQPGPLQLPASLAPPVALAVKALRIDTFVFNGQSPLQGLVVAGLQLDPMPGAAHRAEQINFEASGLAVAGSAQLGNATPYSVVAQTTLRPTLDGDNPRWAAVVHASGTVAALELAATLRGRPLPKLAAPTLDLRAGLRPLRPWLLAHLSAQTQALDLSALLPNAPSTRLSGQASLKGGEQGTPLVASLALDNATPGRWNEGRLPVRKLTLDLRGQLNQPDELELTHFELALADATRSAGRWTGSAVWKGHGLVLDTRLESVTPQRLDSRAAGMTLTGPVAATLRGLPSPDFKATTPATPLPPPGITWKVDLQGQLDAAPQPVQLALEGSADDQRLEIKRAQAQAGSASAEFSALVAKVARGEWQVTTRGSLLDFDPLPWWPGNAGGAWRKGPHRLSGDWQFDVRLPADAERLAPLALAQRVAGNGTLRIHNALLAGVPLAADITLGYTQAAAPTPASLRAELRLAGNLLSLEGRGDPAGSGASDRWRLEVKADTLTGLAPLTLLHPALADWVPRRGTASAVLAADGRWPDMRTEGSARLSQLLVGPLDLARGSVNWAMATQGEQPLSLQLDLAGVVYGQQRADNLRVDLRGTLAEHRIDISGAMPVVPPPVAEQVLGIQAQSGTRAQMQAQGNWLPDPGGAGAAGAGAGGGRWKARIDRLVVGSWDGSSGTAPPASGWAEAHDLRAELQFSAAGKLLTLQADPGRVRLADTASLRWDEVRVDLRGEQAQLLLHADIEPFALAPLLARAQPGMGWQGDMRLSARVDIRAAEKMDADLVFERKDGDLHVVGGDVTQLLGLTELRLAISAHEGVWNFSPVFRGRSLGDISGQVQVQSTPERRWPQPQAPIAGKVQARVPDIGIWGDWVPPGWRLTGQVNTSASLAGTFGAPQFNGELTGSGLGVRNLLQGVNVSDGQVAVKLAGDSAQIERFTLKGGDGTAAITGGATFGAKPQARLQLKVDHFRVLGRVDRQVIASGNAELNFNADQLQIDGKFGIDEALYDATSSNAPTLDADVTVRRPGDAIEREVAPGKAKPQRGFVMNVALDLGNNVHIRGRGLDTYLGGQLRLATPGGRLAINGTINTDRGTYKAYGQNLDIERGFIAFGGEPDNPRLDVLALRPNIDQRVGVLITGNLLSPRVRLYADPEMSDSEKLSWLVLGRASDGLGRNDTALLQRAAVALLSGEGEAPTDALMKSLGIDEVSLRQSEGDVRETVVSIGKQLTRRWYLGYERGVNATTGTWQLIYRIAQRFTLRLQSGLENAADVIWTWRLQETPPQTGVPKSKIVSP